MVGQPKYTLHYYIMQYKTTCNNCKQEYIVDGEPGQTIRAKCPYCGALANVVTPADDYTSVKSCTKSSMPFAAASMICCSRILISMNLLLNRLDNSIIIVRLFMLRKYPG